jgi:hypothetical protein
VFGGNGLVSEAYARILIMASGDLVYDTDRLSYVLRPSLGEVNTTFLSLLCVPLMISRSHMIEVFVIE